MSKPITIAKRTMYGLRMIGKNSPRLSIRGGALAATPKYVYSRKTRNFPGRKSITLKAALGAKALPPPKAKKTVALFATDSRGRLSLHFLGIYFLRRRSAARKAAKTTLITPFMVKKAALSLVRSVGLTRECS
jgi:hypothetical protein